MIYILKSVLFQLVSLKTYLERYTHKFNYFLKIFSNNNSFGKYNLNSEILIDYELSILYDKPLNSKVKISEFPLINRELLKLRLKNSDYYNKVKFNRSIKTSGTSGSALIVPVTLDFLKYTFASFYFFKSIHNSGIKIKSGNFFGRVLFPISKKNAPFWFYSFFTNQLLFSQYHLNSDSVLNYINAIKKYKLQTIHGYPSVLVIFSEFVRKSKLITEIHDLKILNITVGSETLSDNQRKFIEDTFNCPVFNFYGQVEGVVDIFECEKGSMHINEAFSFVELLKTEDKMVFQLVGTQLKNKKFPLIRYNTGDLVEYDPNFVCSCGRTSRVVSKIIGRDEDFIILKNNSKIGRLDHIFKNTVNIIESQIIQRKKGEAIFKIVKSKLFIDKDQMTLERNIKELLGDDFLFSFDYCDNIQKSKNGKLKQVVNLIK